MRRPPVLSLLLVALAAVAGCGDDSATPAPDAPAASAEQTTTEEVVEVTEVVDGDTIEVSTPGGRERVRLVGINAPERGECLADAATRRLRELVGGQQVRLVTDESDRDQYGRLLRYVEVDGTDAGAELVRAGLALARRYPPDTARADDYDALQQEAADAGAGLWAPDACGASGGGGGTTADVAIVELRLDAAGDDNQNLNDEWARIANRGDTPTGLTGWVLKDTSATHRYRFPDGFDLGPGASVTVRTGCGTDTATDLHWCNEGSAVWNNGGDTAFLLDPAGNIVSSLDD